MNITEDDPAKRRNKGMLYWTGQDRGTPTPPPKHERPVFGTQTDTGDLFKIATVFVGEDLPDIHPDEATTTEEETPLEER
jgi:hypothetical protein